MKNLVLPFAGTRPLAFYLAMEEWAARNLPPDEYFFAWRVAPTVICGRNQDIEAEVDLGYCRDHGIDVVRRRSGGGCVFADMDNWMFSYITPSYDVATTFSRYTTMIAGMLRSLGFDAVATGRNDIVIGSRKVAGNAFYHLPGRAIVHGTMLCNIDTRHMSRAITPSKAKLESKAVQSAQARVTSLAENGLAMSVAEFGDYAVSTLTDGCIRLTEDDVAAIDKIAARYSDPAWLARRGKAQRRPAPEPTICRSRRFEGVGEIRADITLDDAGLIINLNLSGDFFVTGDIFAEITSRLRNRPYKREELTRLFADIDVSATITGLSTAMFIDLLID